MAELQVAVFAPVSASGAVRDAVRAGLSRSTPLRALTHLEIETYRAPAHLLGNLLAMCEYRVQGRRPLTAAACGRDLGSAVVRLCGELTERIGLSRFRPQVHRTATEEQLRAERLAVFDTAGYLGDAVFPDRWPFAPYSAHEVVDWTIAEDLADPVTPRYLPVRLCQAMVTRARAWCELTSVGTAAGPTIGHATEHAIREIFERDALQTAWFASRTLEPTDAPDCWDEVRERDAELGWRTTFFRGTTRIGIPLWVVHTLHPGLHLTAIGSSCAPSPEDGLDHALGEALQGRLYTWLTRDDRDRGAPVRTLLDHAGYYSTSQRVDQVRRLFAAGGEHELGRTREDPVHETLDGAARLILHADADTTVVRVLHPRAQPVEADHDAARLVGPTRTLARGALRTAPAPFA
ncbi:MAG TPA: YcaO-like family protein [Mycobacteriales bacterium]|jgi:ribosomal protein S12 methylthiotransferase accessory factor YcaO|nr:YcaO-like family protein [Mycobacteriales bacterium]